MKSGWKLCAITVLLIYFFFPVFAQSLNAPVSLPASPKASSLGEYGNIPISPTTGVPNIQIPLYEIKGRLLTLPISISYRSSGIRVEDIGSDIGVGWTLNGGGVIARAVKGIAETGVITQNGSSYITPRRPIMPLDLSSSDNQIAGLRTPGYDGQPDEYFYNFVNYSGKFIFKANGQAEVSPNENFKVEFPFESKDIIITDDKGTKFYFTTKETTESLDDNQFYTPSQGITSWYLTKIESYDKKETIEFEYENESYFYSVQARERALIRNDRIVDRIGIRDDWLEVNGARLKRITTNFGYSIDIIYGTARIDLINPSNANVIDKIKVSYNTTCLKVFDFDATFAETNNKVDYWNPQVDMSSVNYRLYLHSLAFEDCSAARSYSYSFKYYGLSNSIDPLPNRLSFAQDYWGYYNNQNNNTTLLPSYMGVTPGSGGVAVLISGANRDPSFPAMEQGTLQEITYPTGGRTVFEYEPHQANSKIVGGLRIKAISDYDETKLLRKKTYEYANPSLVGNPEYTSDWIYYNLGIIHKIPYPGCGTTTTADCDQYLLLTSGYPITLGTTNGYHISYGKVIERESGNGYTVYQFTTANQYWDEYDGGFQQRYYYKDISEPGVYPPPCTCEDGSWISDLSWPFVPKTDFSWKRGQLISKAYYKEGAAQPTKTISYEYDYHAFPVINGIKWARTTFIWDNPTFQQTQNMYYFANYTVHLGEARLKKKTVTEQGVTQIITRAYDASNYVSDITKNTSENGQLETIFQYSESPMFQNSSDQGSDYLRATHILSPVLRTIKKKNGLQVYRKEATYSLVDSYPFLTKIDEYPTGNSDFRRLLIDYNYNNDHRISDTYHLNGSYISYLWDYYSIYLIAEVINSPQSDIGYTSFGADGKGNWLFSGIPTTANGGITGSMSYPIFGNPITKSGLTASKKYIVSYWMKAGGASVSGGTQSNHITGKTINGWTYYEVTIADATSVTITGNGYIDEVRLYPADALMTTYTYDPLIGMTSQCDAKNNITYYEYDAFGRLKLIKDENGKILKQYDYQYQKPYNQ